MNDHRLQLLSSLEIATKLSQNDLDKLISLPKEIKNGDFSFPCFLLAKQNAENPAIMAQALVAKIKLPQGFLKVIAVGPYLNFFINREEETNRVIQEVLSQKTNYGRASHNSETIVIDYSAPNIAKPFHVGHLRTTIIGFALYNIFKHLGYNTIGINHIGDWGTQFGFVYAGCKIWGKPREDTIESLVKLYIEANGLRKAQDENKLTAEQEKYPDVNIMARDYFISLENGDSDAITFWQWCLDISLKYLKATYAELGVEFDYYTGESFYIPMFPEIKQRLEASGLLSESRGAIGIELDEKLGFARLLTPDGRSLYLTRDVITADYREKTFHPKKVIYVVGAPQILHFQQLVAVMKKMDHPIANKLIHIPYGHVPGISTRSLKNNDGSLSLTALIEEGSSRALEAYQQSVSIRPENPDVQAISKSVSLGAIYFNYLSRTNNKDFHFSWEEALNFQGDTGPYLLYALARINSMIDKANRNNIHSTKETNFNVLNSDETYEIIKHLAGLQNILYKITEDYEPNHLVQYALNLAKLVSRNYNQLRVVGEDNKELAEARLGLFTACKYVLEISIKLMGIPTLERM